MYFPFKSFLCRPGKKSLQALRTTWLPILYVFPSKVTHRQLMQGMNYIAVYKDASV
jgi:hypothetical protein